MSSLKNNLKEILGNTTMLRVISKQQQEKCFGLREEVFCKQKGWEKSENNINEYDDYSLHYYLNYLDSAEACFRMIPANNPLNMPITKETGITLFNNPIAKKYISELSRLAVNPNQEELYWGTILNIAIEAGNNEMPFLVALMTKPFIRKMNTSLRRMLRMGVKPFQIIGDPVELNGDRYPVIFNISEILMLIELLDKDTYNQYFSESHYKLKEYVNKNQNEITYVCNQFKVLEETTCLTPVSKAS